MSDKKKRKIGRKTAFKKVLYLSIALFLVAGLVLSATFGFIDFLVQGGEQAYQHEPEELVYLKELAAEMEASLAADPSNLELKSELGGLFHEIAMTYWNYGQSIQGNDYAHRGKDLLLKAVEEGLRKPDTTLRVAMLAYHLGEEELAKEYFQFSLELDEDNPEIHLYYGLFLQSLQQNEEAKEHLNKVLELADEDSFLAQAASYYLQE